MSPPVALWLSPYIATPGPKISVLIPLDNQPEDANARETVACDQLDNQDALSSPEPTPQQYIVGKVRYYFPVDIIVATKFLGLPANVSYNTQGVLDESPLDVSNVMD
ncbi:hypothetical protein DSO57_1014437 [Entomophthora muscae]|uniref:Uncharacterized protein n=1 Tax=Entomophthora muscae TaxID=34485 RepID=A0ACC2RK67_9FUNG|nr:hypothetical protein DSO57_1014437 [Entomophthora muscae]